MTFRITFRVDPFGAFVLQREDKVHLVHRSLICRTLHHSPKYHILHHTQIAHSRIHSQIIHNLGTRILLYKSR